jgi:tetratricopeptide (TPR) repeat protein
MKAFKAFISSTHDDLKEYRQAAIEVCNRLGIVPVSMEYFEAVRAGATEASRKKIDEANAFIGIYAHRYGFIEPGHDRSVTELEYDHANAKPKETMEILCFMVEENYPWPPAAIDHGNYDKLAAFKQKIRQEHVISEFTTPGSYAMSLERALRWWLAEGHREPEHPDEGQRTRRMIWQLPPCSDDFVGREEEVRLLTEALSARTRTARTAVISGRAGVGKTQLALKVAEEIREEIRDGAFFCDLKGAEKIGLSPLEVMKKIVTSIEPDIVFPDNLEDAQKLYQNTLFGKEALIMLDNAYGKEQVEPLIPPKPCLLLVTSRRRFALPGCISVPLSPLSDSDAVVLLRGLSARASGYEERIARCCSNLPLVLRLAASVLESRPHLSVEEFLRQMDDAAAKHQSLKEIDAALDVTCSVIDERLKQGFAACSIFHHGFEVEAAAAVWGMDREEAEDVICALFEFSLVEWDPKHNHYQLHDDVRKYAHQHLGEKADEVFARFARHLLDRTRQAERLFLKGGEDVTRGLQLWDQVKPDFFSVIEWSSARAPASREVAALCADLAEATWYLLEARRQTDGQAFAHVADIGLRAAAILNDDRRRCVHLRHSGFLLIETAPTRADGLLDEALRISRTLGDREAEGIILGYKGRIHVRLNRTTEGLAALEESLRIAQERKDDRQVEIALGRLGDAFVGIPDLGKARDYYQQALDLEERIGDRIGLAIDHAKLAGVFLSMQDQESATRHYETSAQTYRLVGDELSELNQLMQIIILCEKHQTDRPLAKFSARVSGILENLGTDNDAYLVYLCITMNNVCNWRLAALTADVLIRKYPGNATGWTEKAYAVRRMTGGSIEAAEEILLDAARRFPEYALIHFNLACYAAQMGKLDEAVERLREAIRVSDDPDKIRQDAVRDEDLEPIRDRLATL